MWRWTNICVLVLSIFKNNRLPTFAIVPGIPYSAPLLIWFHFPSLWQKEKYLPAYEMLPFHADVFIAVPAAQIWDIQNPSCPVRLCRPDRNEIYSVRYFRSGNIRLVTRKKNDSSLIL